MELTVPSVSMRHFYDKSGLSIMLLCLKLTIETVVSVVIAPDHKKSRCEIDSRHVTCLKTHDSRGL